jgi:NitT/TauT family transport system substrate-binding protein
LSFPALPGSINGNACGTTDEAGKTLMRSALAIVFAFLAGVASARAEVSEVRLSKQYGLPYLPFMVMERFQNLEKQAEKQGLTLKVSWTTLSNATAMMDAILSGQMDFITPGVPTLATMWDKTVGTPNEIRALSAVQSMPYVLVTRSEHIKSIRDFTDKDRIALPAVKLTGHAIALQMAAAKEWGREHYDKLDAITISYRIRTRLPRCWRARARSTRISQARHSTTSNSRRRASTRCFTLMKSRAGATPMAF